MKYRTIVVIALSIIIVSLIHPLTTLLTTINSESTQGVRVIIGPTPIMEGEAKGPQDITLMNEYLAVAFGVSTTPPWGITPGHIIDIAPVGEKTADVAAQFSFPLNDWGNWATITNLDIVEQSSSRAVLRAVGKWRDLLVEYTYVLESGKPYLEVTVNVTNAGSTTYSNLIMGPAITFERGWTFVPGYGTGRLPTMPILGTSIADDWVAGYHEDFAIGLYAPGYTHISLHTYFVDPFYQVTLNPGESRVFKAYLVVLNKPDLCRLMKIIYEFKEGAFGVVSGRVLNSRGEKLGNAGVVVYRDGKPICWSITDSSGVYEMPLLAPGSYNLTAVAKSHGPSSSIEVTIELGEEKTVDFTDLPVAGKLIVNVFRNDTGQPTDARILISGGYTPPIQYMVVTTAYTDLFRIGRAEVELAPGTYNITIGYGADFISLPESVTVTIESEKTVEVNVTVNILFKPQEYGWYTVDLHHHSDYMDGKTPPNLLVVSQLASALDFIFVSDHDYIGNCPVIKTLAEQRGVPFICGVEISPDWAHFNVYPVLYPEKLVYRGTLREIIEAARNAGALVVRANHPYIGGLFIAQELNNIPGGYYEAWDTAEINGPWGTDDNKTLMKMFMLWSSGIRKYLTAGSDVHDVLTQTYTGKPRLVVYLPNDPSIEALASAEKNGHSFISYGPFIFTDPIPGSTIFAKSLEDEITVKTTMFSVYGLDRLEIYGKNGVLLKTIPLNKTQSVNLEISIPVVNATMGGETGFVVLIVYDGKGNRAIVNPIWIDLMGVPREITHTTTMYQTTTTTTTYTETHTETKTLVNTVTSTTTTTTTSVERVEVEKYDIAVVAGIIGLVVGLLVGLFIKKKQ